MSLLKELYSRAFYNQIGEVFASVVPGFDKKAFIKKIYSPGFEEKELKERMRHTSVVLHSFLPASFAKAAKMLKKAIVQFRKLNLGEDRLEYMFLPDYIETYGLDDYDTSIEALEFITRFVSCEFAVRPFLLKYTDAMIAQMQQWARHENHKVRRFASEGMRPRLPWGLAVPALKKNPHEVLTVLEQLKNDPSEWVRKSVANCLNDLAKDHPQLVIKTAKAWLGISRETNAIVKHGCRTLLKQGNAEVLSLFSLADSSNIKLLSYQVSTERVRIGEDLKFTVSLHNKHDQPLTVRLEYGIYYLRKNGTHSKKVFKISEREFKAGEKATIMRRQSFKIITTRKYYPGLHKVSIIINGRERKTQHFEVGA
jgi:3-methyladenine DNA glycosylase AlkC